MELEAPVTGMSIISVGLLVEFSSGRVEKVERVEVGNGVGGVWSLNPRSVNGSDGEPEKDPSSQLRPILGQGIGVVGSLEATLVPTSFTRIAIQSKKNNFKITLDMFNMFGRSTL